MSSRDLTAYIRFPARIHVRSWSSTVKSLYMNNFIIITSNSGFSGHNREKSHNLVYTGLVSSYWVHISLEQAIESAP